MTDDTCQKIVLFINDIATYFTQQIQIAADLTQLTSLVKVFQYQYNIGLPLFSS